MAINLCGLNTRGRYTLKMVIVLADNRQWKYKGFKWIPVCRAEGNIMMEYEHPDSPNSGSIWMNKAISFKTVMITNKKTTISTEKVIIFVIGTDFFSFFLNCLCLTARFMLSHAEVLPSIQDYSHWMVIHRPSGLTKPHLWL